MSSDRESSTTQSDQESGLQKGEENENEGGPEISVDEHSDESSSSSVFLPEFVIPFLKDVFYAVVIVAIIFSVLYLALGVWPPFQAVLSGSMDPHISQGDLVVVSDPGNFVSDHADEHGVVTQSVALEHGIETFGGFGSVIVFSNPKSDRDIIHRALFHVEEGEDWYDESYEEFLNGAENCDELRNCPAPNSGYITKGDNNDHIDQALGSSPPVSPDNVVSHAQYRIPWLGWLQILF